MTPSYSDLRYFVEVADTLNISRASERLGITQPTLSSTIQRLESAVGTDLLVRSRVGVQLTKAGSNLLHRSRELMNTWEQIVADVSKNQTEIMGNYVIGCHVSVALYSLPHFVPNLMQKYPLLNLSFVHERSRGITEKVISFEIDFGIVINPIQHPDLVIKPLGKDVVTFWTSSKKTSVQDIASGEAILICDDTLTQSQKLIADWNKKGIQFKRVISTPSLEVITELTRSGAGVGLLPTRVANRVSDLKLLTYSKPVPTYDDQLCLVYRPDLQKAEAAKLIIQEIQKSVK